MSNLEAMSKPQLRLLFDTLWTITFVVLWLCLLFIPTGPEPAMRLTASIDLLLVVASTREMIRSAKACHGEGR